MKLIDCLEIHSKKYNIYLKIWQKENIKRAYLDSSLIADLTILQTKNVMQKKEFIAMKM
jgi:hypothetical protein